MAQAGEPTADERRARGPETNCPPTAAQLRGHLDSLRMRMPALSQATQAEFLPLIDELCTGDSDATHHNPRRLPGCWRKSKRLPADVAREIIERDSGSHFDPAIVEAFLGRFDTAVSVEKQIRDRAPVVIGANSLQPEHLFAAARA